MNNWISAIGLLLDIAGAMLLFFFGLPPTAGTEYSSEFSKEKIEQYKKIAKWGLTLMIIGFMLQFISTISKF